MNTVFLVLIDIDSGFWVSSGYAFNTRAKAEDQIEKMKQRKIKARIQEIEIE